MNATSHELITAYRQGATAASHDLSLNSVKRLLNIAGAHVTHSTSYEDNADRGRVRSRSCPAFTARLAANEDGFVRAEGTLPRKIGSNGHLGWVSVVPRLTDVGNGHLYGSSLLGRCAARGGIGPSAAVTTSRYIWHMPED